MNRFGRLVLNSPTRAWAQAHHVIPELERLGGRLDGACVLEIGCGRGVGTTLLCDLMGAARVDGIDIDPAMIRLALARAHPHATLRVADMTHLDAPDGAYDAVVDLGAIHLEPRWQEVLVEIHRVLPAGGRFYFEEIVRPHRQALAPLATGRRVAEGFTAASLLGTLDAVGFGVVATCRPGALVHTAMVGDLLGVAVRER